MIRAAALFCESLRQMRGNGATGVTLVGDPGFYARVGFASVPGLIYQGVPEQYVLAACFADTVPQSEIIAHEAFGMMAV